MFKLVWTRYILPSHSTLLWRVVCITVFRLMRLGIRWVLTFTLVVRSFFVIWRVWIICSYDLIMLKVCVIALILFLILRWIFLFHYTILQIRFWLLKEVLKFLIFYTLWWLVVFWQFGMLETS